MVYRYIVVHEDESMMAYRYIVVYASNFIVYLQACVVRYCFCIFLEVTCP